MSFDLENIKYLIEIAIVVVPLLIGFILWLHSTYLSAKKTSDNIAKVIAELRPNGGSSLRDVVNRIEHKLSIIDLTQKAYIDLDSQVPIFQTDAEGRFTWVNKAFLTFFNRPIDDILGYGWELIVEQSERETVRLEWYRACQEKRIFEYSYHVNTNSNKVLVKCKAAGAEKSGYMGFLEVLENKNGNNVPEK